VIERRKCTSLLGDFAREKGRCILFVWEYSVGEKRKGIFSVWRYSTGDRLVLT
jgi:hypothetical protein